MPLNRKRTSSTDVKKAVAERAHDKINPPRSMSRGARKHFREIISRRANIDWNDHDISTAVILAEMMTLCQHQQTLLAKDLEENT